MRFFLILFIYTLFSTQIFAEEHYLPESADPKTYVQISECYAHDDITFYSPRWVILGDWKDWKKIKILEDGCFAKIDNRILFDGQSPYYWDNNKNEMITVYPDSKTFHILQFQRGVYLWMDKSYLFAWSVALKIPKWFEISKMRYLQYGYVTDEKNLYYIGSADGSILRIEGIDISSFWVFMSPMWQRFLYDKYGTYNDAFFPSKQRTEDESHIAYINIKEMKSYSSYDFKSLTESWVFVFDSKNIYSPNISVSVDMQTFRLFFDGQLAWDKNHIYTPTWKVISGIDSSNYEYLWKGIIRSNRKLFMWCKPEIDCDWYELTWFDVLSFQVISTGFMDKNGYYDLYFNPIEKPNFDLVNYTGSVSYYHDSKNVLYHVWWNEYQILTGAKLQSFTTFSWTSYAKDSRFCWFEWTWFFCNANTFTPIENWRGKDSKNVYYQNKNIIVADPHSFTGINTWGFNWIETYHYMWDKNRVYYDDRFIRDSDPKTFELMKDLHSKDKNNIYYAGWKIQWVDYNTFTPLRYSFARDKNHFYFAGIILDQIKNPNDVIIVGRNHLRYDGKMKYYECFKWNIINIYESCPE